MPDTLRTLLVTTNMFSSCFQLTEANPHKGADLSALIPKNAHCDSDHRSLADREILVAMPTYEDLSFFNERIGDLALSEILPGLASLGIDVEASSH